MTEPDPIAPVIEDLPGVLDSHAAAWTVLARLHTPPLDQEVIDVVRTGAEDWPLGRQIPALRRGARLLARSAQEEESTEAVHRDVQRLFTGPGHLLAPPYESVHLNSSGLVFDEETLAVRAFYRRFGLEMIRKNREPDDHVAVELELLVTLATRALDALDAGDAPGADTYVGAIAEFLRDHALLWHHRLGELTVEHAHTSFMQGVGSLLMGTSTSAGEVFLGQRPAGND